MRRERFMAAAAVAALSCGAGSAYAQGVSVIKCGPSMAASVGINGNGDRNGEETSGGRDAAATVEVPLSDRRSVRGEAGVVAWTFREHDYLTSALLRQERVEVKRVTVSAVRRAPDCGAPIRPYTGFGVGVYRYRFPDQGVAVTTGGLHGIAGVDVMPDERFGFTAEIGIHAINGPRRKPVFSTVLWSVRATIGARFLF